MRRACIDIGSNTTRLLVADCDSERLNEIHQERVFTHLRRGLQPDGTIDRATIDEIAHVVAGQLDTARELDARDVHAVATAALRQARNAPDVSTALRRTCGIELRILSEHEEARLAFVGAARTLGHVPEGPLGVVDVGGGSSELVVGLAPDQVSWSTSFALGSGLLTDRHSWSDPPTKRQLVHARAEIDDALVGVDAPRPDEAVAVGGSATSLRRLAGPRLDAACFNRCLDLLMSERTGEVAKRFGLDRERVRLLPAGLLILQAASELFKTSLQIARGGLREGVLLEAAS